MTSLFYYTQYGFICTQFVYKEEYIDLAENKEWYERYKHDIPVIHLNGELLMMHQVDQEKLRTALDALKDKI